MAHLTPRRNRSGSRCVFQIVKTRLAMLAAVIITVALPVAAGAAAGRAPTAPSGAPAPVAAASPGTTGSADDGSWRVLALGQGRFEVTWTAPGALPVGSDRPTITGAGLPFGPSTMEDDGRTVTSVVTAATAPEPADLDVVLSGDRLDEPGSDPDGVGSGVVGAAPPTTPIAADDPGVAGPFATVSSDYELPGVKVPGMPRKVEMVGHVVEPASDQVTGPRPLVLFLHGRHGFCYQPGRPRAYSDEWPCVAPFEEIPSHLGYVYIQRLLASQGFATLSVRVNGINAQDYRLDDGGADARARIVAEHLDYWTSIAGAHQVDLSQVVLVGHSRGGEGVDRASIEIPLSAPYRIAGQVLLAPTDFASHTAPYVPTVTVLPYCDGDVSDIQGQKFTDTGRDLAADDTSLKSSVLVMGADHNFFNTEWTPGLAAAPSFDDWGGDPDEPCGRDTPGRLSAAQQRAVGKAYVAGAVRLFTGDDGYLPLFDGSHATVGSIGTADVRSHAIGGGRDERRPGIEATPTLATGGVETRLCTGVSADAGSFAACGLGLRTQITPHWAYQGEGRPTQRFFEMEWSAAGAVGGLRFDDPLDLTTDRLELRTIVDPRLGAVDLAVRLRDDSGGSATLTPEDGGHLDPLLRAPYLTKLWAQPLLVDATGATGVDLADVTSVELVAANGRGRVWVADLAAASTSSAAVPPTRLPQLSLGRLVIDEGDPPAGTRADSEVTRTARVPFTIAGTLTRPARFVVLSTGQERGSRERFTVDLAPGQTSGTIPVAYTADTLDDYRAQVTLSAWPVRGIATDDYLGSLEVRDDDPDPEISVSVPRTVREGRAIVIEVGLSAPADYDSSAYLNAVRGPGTPLRGTDVPPAFLDTFAEGGDPTRTLWRLHLFAYDTIPAGETRARLVIPTASDAKVEGRETLHLRVGTGRGRPQPYTVTVRDASR